VSTLVAGVRSAAGQPSGPQIAADTGIAIDTSLATSAGHPGLRQSRGLHQLPEHAYRWIWLRPPRESWVALGCRSASGAGEEAFGDGSDRLALDLGL